ncbi:GNAT family N-acetyltransferase [Palaeococcus ferrophilus]|uniref:GNAT family N-acetyltransferase n=1 Tax=Palaeococcus ferrophilus TaxID=83868 RepID=UPI00064ECBD9|nr:GNAT family N-acetyltransferase [Palaeococcus ferrophilus]
MEIRKASLDDVAGIVSVHAGSLTGGTIFERYLRGGPWMSLETCSIHTNNLLLHGGLPVVALVEGETAGHAEFLMSEEPIHGVGTKLTHLDVLQVKEGFRGRGVGRALVEFGIRTGRQEGHELLTVTSEKSALGFYSRLGISEIINIGVLVGVKLKEIEPLEEAPRLRPLGWGDVKGREMTLGKFQSSYHHWFTLFVDRIAGVDDRVHFESGELGGSLYAMEGAYNGNVVTAYAWGGDVGRTISLLAGRARALGFDEMRTVVPIEALEEIPFSYMAGERFVTLSLSL